MARLFVLLTALVFAAGCGLKAQTYVMTKERVGIEKMPGGNAGYLTGEPKYLEPQKKTRQVYILEVTKSIPEKEAKKIEEEYTSTSATVEAPVRERTPAPMAEEPSGSTKISIPKIDDEGEPAAVASEKVTVGPKEDITYTVQKDDTLQKIAKKHYGSYSAWTKIYNANKAKLKNNPNLLRSGTVITLPAEK